MHVCCCHLAQGNLTTASDLFRCKMSDVSAAFFFSHSDEVNTNTGSNISVKKLYYNILLSFTVLLFIQLELDKSK